MADASPEDDAAAALFRDVIDGISEANPRLERDASALMSAFKRSLSLQIHGTLESIIQNKGYSRPHATG